MAQTRSVNFLPEIFQTDANRQFLAATLDQLIQEPRFKRTQGYIGQTVGPGVDASDNYVVELNKTRADYQLEPGIISLDPTDTNKIKNSITYPGINDALAYQGANTSRPDRLYQSEYYTWDPFVNFDSFVNFSQYYWIENGPDVVSVSSEGVPLNQTFNVNRANGVYTFSGVDGNLPTLNLVRSGNYVFNVAQNNVETINYRVTRTNVTSYNIDFQPNATLTLVRGNTYVFTLSLFGDFPFWIKTAPTTGTGDQYNTGVQRNGSIIGAITFTVPQDAPDTLYYSCQTQGLMNGTINIVNGTPGNGSKFWIQSSPGVDGKNPTTPNISSREVLGVVNNGTDLGQVIFNVPTKTAQNFYYSLPILGTADLVTDLKFDQIDGIKLSDFIATYGGIDGITNLETRTLIFVNNIVDPVEGGWFYHSTPTVTPVDPTQYTSVWRISYYTVGLDVYIQLSSVLSFPQLNKVSILYGTEYSSTQWWKNQTNLFEQIPALTAEQDVLWYQDGTDPEIFGRIRLIDPAADTTIFLDEILGEPSYTSPNGVKFTNGLKVRFLTNTVPESYATKSVPLTCIGTQAGLNFITCASTDGLASGQEIVFSGDVFGGISANVTYYVKKVFSSSQFSVSTVKGGPAVLLTSAFGTMLALASQNPEYYVSGVGTAIQLLPVENYIAPEVVPPEFQQLGNIDYLTIDRASPDLNAWSRSNRWFHIDVLNATGEYNNTQVVLNNNLRAKRPILQFRKGLRLFNMGTEAKQPVDVIDFLQSDALSNVEGATSYTVFTNNISVSDLIVGNQYQITDLGTTDWNLVAGTNGLIYTVGNNITCVLKGTGTGLVRSAYELVNGSRVIFAADEDQDVRNKIYVVNFISPDSDPPLPAPYTGQPIIHLTIADDGLVEIDQTVLCITGEQTGTTFWYDGAQWTQAQQKNSVQQAPLFDVYDRQGISFSNRIKYPSSTFAGSKLLSYAEGVGLIDPILKFKLQYLTLQNVGDIVFDNNLYKDTFVYVVANTSTDAQLNQGYVREYSDRTDFSRQIGWQKAITPTQIRQQFKFQYTGDSLKLDVAVLPNNVTVVPSVQVFVGSQFQDSNKYTLVVGNNSTTITFAEDLPLGEIIEVDVISNQQSKVAFYQVPINLEKNPINANSNTYTLGTIRQHYESVCENLTALVGPINGANNTRDIGNIIPYGQVILQQSAPLTMAGYFLRSDQYNIFGSIEYNSREYQKFKNQMLDAVTKQVLNFQTAAQILDLAMSDLTAGRSEQNPFYWSDMLPSGNVFTTTTYTITPISTDVFDTVQVYNYTTANYLGLNVYLNNQILTRNKDYVVATDGPRLTVLINLVIGDVLTLQEYSQTYGTYVPNTPSKMGLYPLWRPEILTVTSTNGPTQVLQGHDGSRTPLFGDVRDEVLLEFETRIFYNCKLDGNSIPLSIYDVLPGQFRETGYNFNEVNSLLEQSFLTYVGWNKLDYTKQNYQFSNSFTYNYSQAQNKVNNQDLLGAWRGINKYFYDTQQPEITPWEMLGFSIKPDWWQVTYGAYPWTSDNLNLWDDLELGLVRDPAGEYILPQFARPGLTKVIPLDDQGNLLSPLNSVVGTYDQSQFRRSWQPGDGGPVEASWWNSSDYPFAVMRLLALTRPAKFFALFADRDLYRYNEEFDQILFDNRYRLTTREVENQPVDTNIVVYGDGVSKASYINWIVDYNRVLGTNATKSLQDDLKNIDVRLCYRMASFSDKQYIKLYVEKSSPNTLNTTLLIPDNSYQLLLYKNQPFDRSTYSSVVVQVTVGGWAVYGYSVTQPYFNVLNSVPTGVFKTYDVAGAKIQVPTQYSQNVTRVPYGFVFSTREAVADFLLSYGKLLTQQGFVFDSQENGYILDWPQMVQEFLYWSQQGWAEGTLINLNPLSDKIEITKEQAIVDTINTQTIDNNILDQNKRIFPTRDLNIVRLDNTFRVEPLNNNSLSYVDLRFTSYESLIVLDNSSLFGDLIYNPITGGRQSRLYISCFNTTEWNGAVDAKGFILNQNNVNEWTGLKTYTKGELVKYKNVYWSAANIVQPSQTFNYNDWIQSDYTQIELGLLPNIANKAGQLANSYNINSANLESDNDLLSFGLIGYRPRQYFAALNLDDVSQINIYRQFLDTKGTLQSVDLLGRARLNKEVADYQVYENWAVLRSTYGANANRSYVDLRLNSSLLTANPSTIQIITPQQQSEANQTVLLSNIWKSSFNPTTTDILPTTSVSITDSALPSAGYVNVDDADITVFSLDDPTSLSENLDNIQIGTTIWVAKVNNYDWGIFRAQNVPGVITHICENLDGTCLVRFNSVHGLETGNFLIIKFFDTEINGVYRVQGVPDINSVTIVLSLAGARTVVTGIGIGLTLATMRVAQASDTLNLPYAKFIAPGAKVWVDNNGQDQWQVIEKTDPFTSKFELAPVELDANEAYGASVAQCINRSAMFIGSPYYLFGTGTSKGGVYLYVKNLGDQYQPISPLLTEDSILTIDTPGCLYLGASVTAGSRSWAAAGAPGSLGPNGESNNGYVVILYQDPVLGSPGTLPWAVNQLLTLPGSTSSTTPGAGEFGHSVAMSIDEKWLYVGAPGLNQVHAYGRVEWEDQKVAFVATGATTTVSIDDSIQIDNENQLNVTIDGRLGALNVDYTVSPSFDTVTFTPALTAGNRIVIARNYTKSYVGGSVSYTVSDYLFTANNIDSISVFINNVIKRPYIDYTYDGNTITFTTATASGTDIVIQSRSYWTFVTTLTGTNVSTDYRFGQAVTTSTDGRNIVVGSSNYTVTGGISTITSTGLASPGLKYFNNVVQSSTLGSGKSALFEIQTYNNSYLVKLIDPGYGYNIADTIIIKGSTLGGVDNVNNLTITVASVQNLLEAGALFSFDRNVQKFVYGATANSNSITVLGTPAEPISVAVNNIPFTNVVNGVLNQTNSFSVSGNIVTLNTTLKIGDVIEIESNQFAQQQRIVQDTVEGFSNYGSSVDLCTYNCSLYAGAPNSSLVEFKAGAVERTVNQARIYGAILSTVAYPSLGSNQTLRVNNVDVLVPPLWTNASSYEFNDVVYVVSGENYTFYQATSAVPSLVDITNASYWTQLGTVTTAVFAEAQLQGLAFAINAQAPNATASVSKQGYITILANNSAAAPEGNKLQVAPGSIGTVYQDLGFEQFVFTQAIVSPRPLQFSGFGASLTIDKDTATNLVVGAPRGSLYQPCFFDIDPSTQDPTTIFDADATDFFSIVVQSGAVYTFDYLPSSLASAANPGKFVFGQQVQNISINPQDQFGTALNYVSGILVTTAPGQDFGDSTANYGAAYIFENPTGKPSWQVQYQQLPSVNIRLLSSVYMYDRITSAKTEFFDFFDPLQGKILGAAASNIDYIASIDPAQYNLGAVNNNGTTWAEAQVGKVWWNISTVRFIDPNQDNISYAARRWGQVFPGSVIDVYQWVSSPVPPSSYAGPGTVFSTTSFSVTTSLNNTGTFTTRYYFWVKGITTVDTNIGKTLSVATVANYIADPKASGIAYLIPLSANAVAICNSLQYVNASDTILSIEFDQTENDANVHQEYELIAQGRSNSFLSDSLYQKLQDSFCGVDTTGNLVPDLNLPLAQRYGVSFRPRQSMFVDRFLALQNYIDRTNSVLARYAISENASFNLLNSADPIPLAGSDEWNLEVANLEVLSFQNIYTVTVPLGYKYLVLSDSSNRGLWTIYTVVPETSIQGARKLQLTKVQNYKTNDYWSYIDWYQPGYNKSTQIAAEVPNTASLRTLNLPIGSSVKVTANARGKFEIYLLTDQDWERVALQDGTIEISNQIYDYATGNFGFDREVFDSQYFDQEPSTETRKIIQAINQELFVGDLAIERNNNLMVMFDFILSEFAAPEWLVKTSLIDVDHKIRSLVPFQNYIRDNQDFVIDYIQEVKPYHVQIREFNLTYYGADQYSGNVTDFDVPAYYDTDLPVPQFVSPILLPYAQSLYQPFNINSNLPEASTLWSTWPYSQWYNNHLMYVESIRIAHFGSGYVEPPVVTIQAAPGDFGSGAKAVAIINTLGQVVDITVIEPGSGYKITPIVVFAGVTADPARGYAVMKNDTVRQFKTTIKYDRYQYQTNVETWTEDGTYDNGTLVRYSNRVWRANNLDGSTAVSGPTFELDQWEIVPASELSGVDRSMGFYVAGVNETGLDLYQLIPGTSYPGVQVWGDYFLGSDANSLTITCTSSDSETNLITCNNTLRLNVNDPIKFYGSVFGGIVEGTTYYINQINSVTEFKISAEFGGSPLQLTTATGTMSALITQPLDARYASSFTDQFLGLRPTDINVDGGEFIGPYEGHAPEELVNGSEFDTVDIRVYTRSGSDWTNDGHGFQVKTINYVYSSTANTFSWAGLVPTPTEIIVFNVTSGLNINLEVNYTVDWINQTVTVLPNAAVNGDIISIFVYEVGGGSQLYKQYYFGNEIDDTVLVPVNSSEIFEVAVFINGIYLHGVTWQPYIDSETWNTANTYSKQSIVNYNGDYYRAIQTVIPGVDINDVRYWVEFVPTLQSIVELNTTVQETDAVSIVVMGTSTPQYTWSTPQTQYIVVDQAILFTQLLTLTNSLQGTNPANLILEKKGLRLRPPEGIEWLGDGTSVEFGLPQRGGFSQESINAFNDISVWVDNVLQTQSFGSVTGDYSVTNWDGSNTPGRQVVFSEPPVPGAKILISVSTLADYRVAIGSNQIQLNTNANLGDIFSVTTWNDTSQQDILTLVFVGPVYTGVTIFEGYDAVAYDAATVNDTPGSFDFSLGIVSANNELYLQRPGITADRLWVTINGKRLIEGQDFTIENDYLILSSGVILGSDVVVVTEFARDVVPNVMTFRIFQDMSGQQTIYRITDETTTTLAQPLSATADIIYVADASKLGEPDLQAGYFGVITIDGERILYRNRDLVNNTMSGLQRGTAGTGAANHETGAMVYDIGVDNRMPSQDQNYAVASNVTGSGTSASQLIIGSTYTITSLGTTDFTEVGASTNQVGVTFVASAVTTGTGTAIIAGQTSTVFVAPNIEQADLGDSSSIFRESIEVYVGGIRARIGTTPGTAVEGQTYTIASIGNTDWQAMGLPDNVFPAPGVVFTVTAVGSGTGLLGSALSTHYYDITAENPLEVTFFTSDDLPAPATNVEVTILQRRGVNWYRRGLSTPSDGRPLQITDTTQARFLRGE
jgi:hypothetical protein